MEGRLACTNRNILCIVGGIPSTKCGKYKILNTKYKQYSKYKKTKYSLPRLHKQGHSLDARRDPKQEMRDADHPSSDQPLIVTTPANPAHFENGTFLSKQANGHRID